MGRELLSLATLSALLFSLQPSPFRSSDLSTNRQPVEGFAAVLPEQIRIPAPFLIDRRRPRNGYLPNGIDQSLLTRKELLFPETR